MQCYFPPGPNNLTGLTKVAADPTGWSATGYVELQGVNFKLIKSRTNRKAQEKFNSVSYESRTNQKLRDVQSKYQLKPRTSRRRTAR